MTPTERTMGCSSLVIQRQWRMQQRNHQRVTSNLSPRGWSTSNSCRCSQAAYTSLAYCVLCQRIGAPHGQRCWWPNEKNDDKDVILLSYHVATPYHPLVSGATFTGIIHKIKCDKQGIIITKHENEKWHLRGGGGGTWHSTPRSIVTKSSTSCIAHGVRMTHARLVGHHHAPGDGMGQSRWHHHGASIIVFSTATSDILEVWYNCKTPPKLVLNVVMGNHKRNFVEPPAFIITWWSFCFTLVWWDFYLALQSLRRTFSTALLKKCELELLLLGRDMQACLHILFFGGMFFSVVRLIKSTSTEFSVFCGILENQTRTWVNLHRISLGPNSGSCVFWNMLGWQNRWNN